MIHWDMYWGALSYFVALSLNPLTDRFIGYLGGYTNNIVNIFEFSMGKIKNKKINIHSLFHIQYYITYIHRLNWGLSRSLRIPLHILLISPPPLSDPSRTAPACDYTAYHPSLTASSRTLGPYPKSSSESSRFLTVTILSSRGKKCNE